MRLNALQRRAWILATLTVVLTTIFTLAITSVAQAAESSMVGRIPVTLLNTALSFTIFILGLQIVYYTRGGFMAIAFFLITLGITLGWVTKLGVNFLIDSAILATIYDLAGIAEALGGIALVTGFVLLREKIRG